MEEQTAFIDEWPRISFEEIEEGVDNGRVGAIYKSFFSLLRLPETMFSSFLTIFKITP